MKAARALPLLVLLAIAGGGPANAESPTCTGDSNLLQWPADNPVWELCWIRPDDSSGVDGSGLEIHDVYYRGILVMKRGHVPMLNVDYESGGCGCFRDWLHSERSFRADNQVTPPASGYYEPTFPAETVCDHAIFEDTPPGDCPWGGPGPCNSGVAAEFKQDYMRLTTQASAGWYRYAMRWTFHMDGTIEPTFGFGTYNTSCSGATHRHHAYWRFDFDIDGADGDTVAQFNGTSPGAITEEVSRTWEDGTVYWEITDNSSGRGYRLTPGSQDIKLAVDGFSRTDFMATVYKVNEYGDAGFGCEVSVDSLVNGDEWVDPDVVLYYRGGVQDVRNTGPEDPPTDIHLCKVAGPMLTPIGDWLVSDIFNDGFESGDTAAWSEAVQ